MTESNAVYGPALLLALAAGSAIFFGALLASREDIRPRWLEAEFQHGVTALGGGALLAAVALVLVPEGMRDQPLATAILTFFAGGLFAMGLDRFFARNTTPASQLAAMLLDFVPETIVIGAIITKNFSQAVMLTLIIFVQNLPESFIAFQEMRQAKGRHPQRMLFWFFLIAVSGPAYVLLGAAALADQPTALAMLMTFCAGGILYLVFNDVAPQVPLKNYFLPPMGALLGFLIGMIGYKLTGG